MKKIVLTCLLAAALPCHAFELDGALYCNSSVREFFGPLVQNRLIASHPFAVNDSVNVFKPGLLAHLTAFHMKVAAVFGYTDDPLLFVRGPGTAPPDQYGVVVRESIANVQAALASVGATSAQIRLIGPSLTEIACAGK